MLVGGGWWWLGGLWWWVVLDADGEVIKIIRRFFCRPPVFCRPLFLTGHAFFWGGLGDGGKDLSYETLQ